MPTHRPIETIARARLVHRSSLLLCQNTEKGYLYLPGGHVEFGETAAQALARELIEECGLRVRVGACEAIAEVAFGRGKKRCHEINLVFHVEPRATWTITPAIRSREPGIAFTWVRLSDLGRVDFRPECLGVWLQGVKGRKVGSTALISDVAP